MNLDVEDTIVAIASAPGSSLRGIIRLSGPNSIGCLTHSFFDQQLGDQQQSACRWLANLTRPGFDTRSLQLAPNLYVNADLLVWPDQHSYTRQVSAEIHTIGSQPVLQLILNKLLEHGCRLAEPGEFTMRAFLSGRLDLTQAEAVIGIIDAQNRKQFEQAYAQLAGGIGGPITDVRDSLISLLAELEAGLDFVEEDIEFISPSQLQEALNSAAAKIDTVTNQIESRHRANERINVVLFGRPNVGKSSLFNKLTGSNAIVSEIRGTTRDYIKTEMEIDNLPIELVDTAGLDAAFAAGRNSVEVAMAGQSDSQIESADIRILCLETGTEPNPFEQQLINNSDSTLIVVWTKCDRQTNTTRPKIAGLQTSAIQKFGLDDLKAEIELRAKQIRRDDAAGLTSTMARTADSLVAAANSIGRAKNAAVAGLGEEVIAAEIRTALDHLGRVVGTVYTDDILDLVFSRFCIGK